MKIIKTASKPPSLTTVFKLVSRRVVDFSQPLKPTVLTKPMLTKVNYPILALFCLFITLTACRENNTQNQTLNIAVASNFEQTLKKIIEQYPKKHYDINIIAGSSGVLANQILNNAPYDLFLSADTEKPHIIYKKLNLTTKPTVYAIGKLALWIPKLTGNDCLNQLKTNETIKTLAIANPKTAPYGKVAQGILNNNSIKIEKTIQTANASQAYIYTKDGLTQAGFAPYSLVINETKGCMQVFENKELNQAMVLLNDRANAIYTFIQSSAVQNIIRNSGYQ